MSDPIGGAGPAQHHEAYKYIDELDKNGKLK